MLLAILILIQTACPKYLTQQNPDVRVHHPEDHGSADSGSGWYATRGAERHAERSDLPAIPAHDLWALGYHM